MLGAGARSASRSRQYKQIGAASQSVALATGEKLGYPVAFQRRGSN
jgi:hypothetical protein